jgi:DNA-binding MarR family transcriptional regulator
MSRDATALSQQLRDLYARLTAIAASASDDVSLTTTQRMALFELTGEPVRLGELATRIAVSDPTASRAVDGLVAAGLAARVPDPDDRRAVRIDATPAGRAYVESRTAAVRGELATALEGLEENEVAMLVALLGRLNAGLRPGAEPGVAAALLLAGR